MNPIVRRYVKHATLVERCFPVEKTSGAMPNSNELSYLVYYTQSKPAKLTKVGSYLSKRIAKDAQKRRYIDVHIGLRIFDELLDSCGRDLHFFAKDVLESLDAALSAHDTALSKAATRTFTLFCRCHTGATLAIDKDLCSLYSGLIRTFASYANVNNSGQLNSALNTALGLCAIQAISESQATYATDCYFELPRIVKATISCIAGLPIPKKTEPVSVEEQVGSIESDVYAASNNCKETLGSWAWQCLETLIRRSHGQHSHVIVAEIFKQLDTSLQWQPISLCVQIMTDVINQLQPQDQNMVIVETLALLTSGAHTSHLYLNATMNSDGNALRGLRNASSSRVSNLSETHVAENGKEASRRTCIIRILERLFCQPHVLVGISVMEALNVLVAFLLECVAEKQLINPDHHMFIAILETAVSTTSTAAVDEYGVNTIPISLESLSDHYYLLAAIGGLARYQYYSNQLADMVEYIIQQMQLEHLEDNKSSDTTEEGEKRIGRQLWLTQLLYIVLSSDSVGEPKPTQGAAVPLRIFAPLFTLVAHKDQHLRTQAADCIIAILQHNQTNDTTCEDDDQWETELTDAVYRKLGGLLKQVHQSSNIQKNSDYAAIAGILCGLLNKQRVSTIQYTLAIANDCSPTTASSNRAWITLLAMTWIRLADISSNSSIEASVNTTVEEAKIFGFWDSAIERVCTNSLRVIALYGKAQNAQVLDKTAADIENEKASLLASALSYKSILDALGPEVAAQYEDTRAKQSSTEEDFWTCNPETVDRVLCGQGKGSANMAEMTNAASHVKDIWARVSVDWDAQIRRDSILAPQVNVDQLRAVLRDGLAMYSDENLNNLERNEYKGSTSKTNVAHQSRAIAKATTAVKGSDDGNTSGGEHKERSLDMYGQPIPEEVRDLLDSIDDCAYVDGSDDEMPLQTLGESHGNSRGNSTISTPIIETVD
ncbi:plasma membrane localization protein [Coemansia sp. RSA 1358]|nr:plasma membrane localization protein [Coemansia umbellata]KAJ2625344.1 plasma membrane localization protein [Coemansia sp. RSA 1358]